MEAQPPPAPEPPTESKPTGDPDRVKLWENVRDVLLSLGSYFRSDLAVHGVLATDLFTFNSSLGATIEQQVVNQLNQLRNVWDPDKKYSLYRFERQPQRFPDVVLRSPAPGQPATPLLGVELKGWYALSKEGEPTFRYTTTPAVCSEFDLLAVFPWALEEVIAGSPLVFQPWVKGAKFLAEYRNWHWRYQMEGILNREITLSTVTHHYPEKSDPIQDRANDPGGNFGRTARTGLMDEYLEKLQQELLSGIPLYAWTAFFKMFTKEGRAERVEALVRQISRMRPKAQRLSDEEIKDLVARFEEIASRILPEA